MHNYRNILQSCHLNFLIGSGASAPYFSTLKNIEQLLTDINKISDESLREKLRASILKKYFSTCIEKNIDLLDNFKDFNKSKVGESYIRFFRTINNIVLNRKNNLINKQVNLFTTNMDIFQECAFETLGFEHNDGFSGRIFSKFSLSNYKKSIHKTSSHYNVISEIPVFNLLKLHGSVTWKNDVDNVILHDQTLAALKKIKSIGVKSEHLLPEASLIYPLKIEEVQEICKDIPDSEEVRGFLESYDKLAIIKPTKDKFKSTTLNYTYYEMLRMFSNELEKENSVLFVIGFSFADEHLREIIIRSVKSNPTLFIFILSYDSVGEQETRDYFTNSGVDEIPSNLCFTERREVDEEGEKLEIKFSLSEVEYFFRSILQEIKKGKDGKSS